MFTAHVIDSSWNRLNLLAQRGNLATADWVRMMLNIGLDALGMDMGIISHVVGEDYTIQFCTNPRYRRKQFTLAETYCDLTLQHDEVVHLAHISRAFNGKPLADALNIESYIGMPLYIGEQLYGTVCFVRTEPRRRDFSSDEVKFMAMLTQAVANAFQQVAA